MPFLFEDKKKLGEKHGIKANQINIQNKWIKRRIGEMGNKAKKRQQLSNKQTKINSMPHIHTHIYIQISTLSHSHILIDKSPNSQWIYAYTNVNA